MTLGDNSPPRTPVASMRSQTPKTRRWTSPTCPPERPASLRTVRSSRSPVSSARPTGICSWAEPTKKAGKKVTSYAVGRFLGVWVSEILTHIAPTHPDSGQNWLAGANCVTRKGIDPFYSEGAFAIYDLTTDKWATQMKKERATVSSLSYSTEPNLLACTFDCREKNEIIVWDLKGIVDPNAKKGKKEKNTSYAVGPIAPVLTGIWMRRGNVGKARSFPNPQEPANCVTRKEVNRRWWTESDRAAGRATAL